jgi:predicted nucleic acid-binding protein
LVIADTSPINYLIQIHQIELLPRLFERVALPSTVQSELSHVRAPLPVQEWIANPPGWLEIHATPDVTQVALEGLDEGETAAIALAEALHADLLLIDEREGFRIAMRRGLPATGTLGVLDLAAERGLVDFAAAITALERTSFRLPATLLKILLAKHKS